MYTVWIHLLGSLAIICVGFWLGYRYAAGVLAEVKAVETKVVETFQKL
jgi:hypothetical protein